METKRFASEEIEMLRNNPYTFKLTPAHLLFTAEFKEMFWRQYNNGASPKAILKDVGYDPAILGASRINGIRNHICEEFEKNGNFISGRAPRKKSADNIEASNSMSDEISQLRSEVKYLRQEVDFLKKFSSVRAFGKSVKS